MIDIPAIPLDKGIIEKDEREAGIGDKTITLASRLSILCHLASLDSLPPAL